MSEAKSMAEDVLDNRTRPSEGNDPAVVKHNGPQRKPLSSGYIHKVYSAAMRAVSDTAARRLWGNSKDGTPIATLALCAEIARLNIERIETLGTLRVTLAMAEDFLTDPTQDQDHFLTALDGCRAALAKAEPSA